MLGHSVSTRGATKERVGNPRAIEPTLDDHCSAGRSVRDAVPDAATVEIGIS